MKLSNRLEEIQKQADRHEYKEAFQALEILEDSYFEGKLTSEEHNMIRCYQETIQWDRENYILDNRK